MTEETIPEEGAPNVEQLLASGPIFGEGTAASHRFGVIYQGPWETLADGTCRAVRRNAVALSRAGLPVLLKSFNHTRVVEGIVRHVFDYGHDPNVLSEIGTLHQTSIATSVMTIKHMVIKHPEQVILALNPRQVLGANQHETQQWQAMIASLTVLYTVWERDRIPKDVARVMSRAGQCWVPCLQNRRALIDSGVPEEKVFVVPHPYSAEEEQLVRSHERLTAHFAPAFYSIGAWQPRKGMHELLGAFLMAFKPGEATLRLRTTEYQWKNYPSPRESIVHWMNDQAVKDNGWTVPDLVGKVEIFTHNFTPQEMHQFHCSNSIYVSASHGEAWNLPAFDAKRYGNLMVHVPWGGTMDFCNTDDIEILHHKVSVDPAYGWGDCQWAGYYLPALVYALHRAAKKMSGTKLRPEFSEAAVGARMVQLLRKLSSNISVRTVQQELFKGVS